MIVSKTVKQGPAPELTFNGPDKTTNPITLKIYGKSVQNGTPTVDNPIPITYVAPDGEFTLRVASGSSIIDIVTTVANGLKGIPFTDEQFRYLVGNGAYLTTQDSARLMAK